VLCGSVGCALSNLHRLGAQAKPPVRLSSCWLIGLLALSRWRPPPPQSQPLPLMIERAAGVALPANGGGGGGGRLPDGASRRKRRFRHVEHARTRLDIARRMLVGMHTSVLQMYGNAQNRECAGRGANPRISPKYQRESTCWTTSASD
jgi:hypothetical protein